MEMLLDELKIDILEMLRLEEFEQYLFDIDDRSIWKNKKNDAIVNEFYIVKFELWNNRLIERIFYINQKWEQKIKQYYNIYEVQRFLAGSRFKLDKGIYQAAQGGVKPIYWRRYEDCSWCKSPVDSTRCDVAYRCYSNIRTVYINSYDPFLKQSIHKYCGFEFSGLEDNKLFWFLYQYEKHPQMEFIAKMGLMDIVIGNLNCIRWSQKGYKLLGLENKNEVEKVRMCDHHGGLKFFRKHKDDIKKYNLDTKHKIFIYDILYQRHFSLISTKLINYIDEIDKENRVFYHYFSKASDYIDYIGFCKELEIPLTSLIKYPDDFKKAHDEMQDKIKVYESKSKTKNIQRQVIKTLFKYRYANADYIITPANSVKDLLDESRELNHCVRTYASRYAKGETAIFLIRKRNDVLTPFYTLELKNNKIEQVRGKNNCDPIEEVKKFVMNWAKKNHIQAETYQGY